MASEALLLTSDGLSGPDLRIGKLLEFFGVSWQAATIQQFSSGELTEAAQTPQLICSSEILLELATHAANSGNSSRPWHKSVGSVFVYGQGNSAGLQRLLRTLMGSDAITVTEENNCARDFWVADDGELCGAMAGVRVEGAKGNGVGAVVHSNNAQNGMRELIRDGRGAIFVTLEFHGVPVFISTCDEIIDINAEVGHGLFNIRDHVATALPIVLYIKWAFAHVCWQPAEINACLVIDDPLLKPIYGCVNFQELLALMERHRFSTNIAFIPWNWRRNSQEVVRLFKENPDKFSLSVHGCDHTRAEFGSPDRERLYWKARQALEWMNQHESDTGLRYDRVMVFPHGAFSEAAMHALKCSDFAAAVNSEVMSAAPRSQPIRISDVWDIAVMRYGGFAMFTRRDPSEGIENFAFDTLLGKPCIICTHHDFCRDRCKHLVDLVSRLNSLNQSLFWRSLGEVVRRSYRQRSISPSQVEVEMYGAELQIENRSDEAKRFLISRPEPDPSLIEQIRVESGRLPWRFSDEGIHFELEVRPHDSVTVHVHFQPLKAEAQSYETIPHRIRTMLRRYASELRDNYFMTNKLILGTRLRAGVAGNSGSRSSEKLLSGEGSRSRTVFESNS